MSKLFEIFGYPVSDTSEEAKRCRQAARCPFLSDGCDGGGNRYLSHVNLEGKDKTELRDFFGGKLKIVPAGICSIQLSEGQPPWIVCPRRLLAIKRDQVSPYQYAIFSKVRELLGYPSGTTLGVWPEIRIKYHDNLGAEEKVFDYTFDYIVAPLRSPTLEEVEAIVGKPWKVINQKEYQLIQDRGVWRIHNFPVPVPSVIEVMTSSTSGGDKKKRTTVQQSFEDAILGKPHFGPGINYRQV